MSDPSSNSSPSLHKMFQISESSPIMNQTFYLISSVWEDDRTEEPDNNQWKCLLCDIKFEGINSTKALARVLRIMVMHIMSFSRN